MTLLNKLAKLAKHTVGLMLLVLVFVLPLHSKAQILQGQWVDDTQAQIEKHRKADVTVIVLDMDDRAVKGAKVRLIQQRHDFALGLRLPVDRDPPEGLKTLPVYRCFNAIALDRYTDWSLPPADDPGQQAKRLDAWHRAIDPMHTSFGPVISADPARNNDRLSLLGPADLRDAILARIDLAAIYEPAPDAYCLYADVLQQDMVQRKLGQGMLHRMFDRADAKRPQASFGLRVRNGVSLQRGRDMLRAIQKLEVRQVQFDHITIEQAFGQAMQPIPMKRMFEDYIAPLPRPVTLAAVEAGGSSPLAAAINIETVVRLAFAEPRIAGLSFAGLTEGELLEENAALIDSDGKPTASGEALDQLFTKLWRSDVTGQTDERGNVQSRVFTGWYTISATLPDGSVITSEAYIPKADRAKMIVLQKTAAEAK